MGLPSDNLVIMGHKPYAEKANVRDGPHSLPAEWPTIKASKQFRYLGSCEINGELVHNYEFHD